MKYSLLILFHAVFAGLASLLTLFLIQTAVRRVFKGSNGELEAKSVVENEPEMEDSGLGYSPHAFVLNLIQGLFLPLSFLFPLAVVILSKATPEFSGVILLFAVLFLGIGILIAEKAGKFRAQNPYPVSDIKNEND